MGKCSNCGKKIEYNKFKYYRGKILCYDRKTKTGCYTTRLERKRAKKEAAEAKIKEDEAKLLKKAQEGLENGAYNPFEENQKEE